MTVNLLKAKRGDLYLDEYQHIWEYKEPVFSYGRVAGHLLYIGDRPDTFNDKGYSNHPHIEFRLIAKLNDDSAGTIAAAVKKFKVSGKWPVCKHCGEYPG